MTEQERLLSAGWLYLQLHEQMEDCPDEVLVDSITALRDVCDKHQSRPDPEIMAIRTMLADLTTELNKRAGNRAR